MPEPKFIELAKPLRRRYIALWRWKADHLWAQRTVTLTHRGFYMWGKKGDKYAEFDPNGFCGHYDDAPHEEFIASDYDMATLLEPIPDNLGWPGATLAHEPPPKRVLLARINADRQRWRR